MPIDATQPQSPGWWLLRLGKKLDADRNRYNVLSNYYKGDHPLPASDARVRLAFLRFQRKARSNFTALVSDSVRERLKILGFRTGGQGSTETDADAWAVWQANKLDAAANQIHDTALTMSRAFVIIGPNEDDPEGVPIISGEDPRQVTYEPNPLDWRSPLAALKSYTDDVRSLRCAVLYLPDAIYYFTAGAKTSGWLPSTWSVDASDDTPADTPTGEVANTVGEVPVVPFVNRPDLFGNGLGEFEDITDIQDRINHTLLNRMVIAELQAYRQRWATGVSTTSPDGNPEAPFVPGVDLLWSVEEPNARFGDFTETNLDGVLKSIRDDITDLAAITRTPPHYLLGSIVNASGDALTAAETGLVSKVRDRQVEYGEQWEEVNRIAGLYQRRTVPEDAEVIWKDPESRSMAELADASVKKMAAGVPWNQRMTDLQYTPGEIARMDTERAQDAALAAAFAPPSLPAPAPAKPGPPVLTGANGNGAA